MTKKIRPHVLRFILPLCLALPLFAAPQRELPPVAAFTDPQEFRRIKISPDGSAIAISSTREFVDILTVIDLATMQPKISHAYSNGSIENLWWKGSDRLVLLLRSNIGGSFFRVVDLKDRKTPPESRVNMAVTIVNPLPADPDHMVVLDGMRNAVKFNFANGDMDRIEKHQTDVTHWLVNNHDVAIAAGGWDNGNWFMLTRPSVDKEWQRIPLGNRTRPDFWPAAASADQHRIVGWDNASANTVRVVIRDPISGQDEVIAHSDEADADNLLIWGDDYTHIRAVTYETDRTRAFYLDAKDAALATSIDAALPDTFNWIVSASADEKKLIIHSTGDTSPGIFYFFDRTKGQMARLGTNRPALDPSLLAAGRYFRFPARDGLALSAKIYLPPAGGPRPPLVVMMGDSLIAKTSVYFEPVYQLLVSRGYAVLQVNHRGVEGFGQKLAQAGLEQIDGKMGDDLADAVKHVADAGWVDAKRVAIMGEYQAGMLALFTLPHHQETFSAWINIGTSMHAGVLRPATIAFGMHENTGPWLPKEQDFKLQRYSDKLDPIAQLKLINVPSFHYYWGYEVDRVQKYLPKPGLTVTIMKAPSENHWSNDWATQRRQLAEETARIYGGVLKFLAAQFPTEANPAP